MAQTLVALSAEDLSRAMRDAVLDALAEHDGRPALLDRTGLARALSCSPSHIDVLRKRGLPTVYVGEAPRFELGSVLTWLRQPAVE
jgi:hypothetical protein